MFSAKVDARSAAQIAAANGQYVPPSDEPEKQNNAKMGINWFGTKAKGQNAKIKRVFLLLGLNFVMIHD